MTSKKKRTRPKDSDPARGAPSDAGAWSFLGYLYQLIGTAASPVSLLSDEPKHLGELDALIEIESHGQDAVVIGDETAQLIQFKHSEKKREISPSELSSILDAMSDAEASLRARRTVQTVEWVLKTNRPLSAIARKVINGELETGAGRTATVYFRNLRAQGLRLTVENLDWTEMESVLDKQSHAFGISERPKVIDRVVALLARVIQKPVGLRLIRSDDLALALAGYEGAKSVMISDCVLSRTIELEQIASALNAPVLDDIIPRASLRDLLPKPDEAIVLVTGPGGVGKTVSVLRALRDLASTQRHLVGAIMPGPSPRGRSVGQLVADWRGAQRPDSIDESIARLRIANGNIQKPVLVLALDGLDESEWREDGRVTETLAYFMDTHNRPASADALLVVTARNRQQFLSHFPRQGAGGARNRDVREIPLDEFTDDELLTVWRKWFPGEPEPVLVPTNNEAATFGEVRGAPTVPMSSALHHPILVGCVSELSPQQRQGVIAGDAANWRAVLDIYLEWFSGKVMVRHGFPVDTVMDVLRAVARATTTNGNADLDFQAHWIEPARADIDATDRVFRNIFLDAITAGVIESSLGRFEMPDRMAVPWRWCLRLVPEHLSGQL